MMSERNVGGRRQGFDRPHRERCTRLLVRTAGKNVKYHLNQMALDLFTARNVTRNIDRKDFSRENA
jgi:hypothetical protein